MNDSTMLRIIEEKMLSSQTEARLDEAGNLVIVQDVTVEEDKQQYIHLTPSGVQALLELLNDNE